MRILPVLLACVLFLPGCVWRTPVRATLDAPAADAHELPAEFAGAWVIVEATVNGRGPYRFVLDTGAEVGVISPGLAAELGLEPAARVRMTDIVGEQRPYDVATAARVRVGPVRFERMPFIVTDALDAFAEQFGVHGLIGYPGFDRFTLDIDYPRRALRVSATPLNATDHGVVPLRRTRDSIPLVPVRIADPARGLSDARWFGIDTGTNNPMHLPAEHAHWAPPTLAGPSERVGGLSGAARLYPVALVRGDLSIGHHRIDHATTAKVGTAHALIGQGLLRHFRVRLDPTSGLAAFTRPDPPAPTLADAADATIAAP